jgi:hypothetical protein
MKISAKVTPFIVRYAERIPPSAESQFRYDAAKQLGQQFSAGKWGEIVEPPDGTRFTAVSHETTDDR